MSAQPKLVSTTQIQIEKGVAAPKSKGGSKYPWNLMEVGDSFFVPGAQANTLQTASRHATKKNGWKFVTRPEGNGARIWRIS